MSLDRKTERRLATVCVVVALVILIALDAILTDVLRVLLVTSIVGGLYFLLVDSDWHQGR